ncbi:TlpA family protein disulfide reductase [Ulvibacterium marinum]|uniref:TlpA family protein disulfide reductase n=1 Tax=Ulvibacterium marinum TaxID=2419782 RepID=A0A3B0C103_9FLAO|nr:TlpA disulfide reductase family protein [Ulvibacterium marinum]RKN78421.1 TlpA family protein disulfide reductase [Ulvibacterium marinum]
MRTIKILVLICIFSNGCRSQQGPEITFSFEVKSEEITSVTISKYNYDLEKMVEWKSLDNLIPQKTYQTTDEFLEPSIYALKLNTGKGIKIAVEQGGMVHIKMEDGIKLESKIASNLDFNKSIENLNNQFFAGMIQDFDKAMKENNQQRIAELEKEKDKVLLQFIRSMENLVMQMGPSAKAYDALGYFDLNKNSDFFEEMMTRFEAEYPSSGMSKSLKVRINKAAQLAIGSKMTNFKATNKEGVLVNLSDYEGSYILVDFWASWCRPCRVENPKLLELYKSFEGVKFEIIGISIDSDRGVWEKAIQKDGIVWNQILDKDQTIYKQYLLSSLPANFLLDQEGRIIAKNITAEELKTKLETFE